MFGRTSIASDIAVSNLLQVDILNLHFSVDISFCSDLVTVLTRLSISNSVKVPVNLSFITTVALFTPGLPPAIPFTHILLVIFD